MAYVCELNTGQRVYLDNQGQQTIITPLSSGAGQQQQSSSGFSTGTWTVPPQVFQVPNGVVLKITSTSGEHWIQIQGSSMGVISGMPSMGSSQQMQVQQVSQVPGAGMTPMESMQPMQPMTPMKPMEPMKPMNLNMGDMQMSMNPMEMRMGNMELKMGTPAPAPTAPTRRFCNQCGAPVTPTDRFCASCGNSLS